MPSLRHDDDELETPQWLFKKIEDWTGLKFDLDLCANSKNKKCSAYIGKNQDALKITREMFDFYFPTIFCNPPRSKNGKFVNLVHDIWKECNLDIVMLLCWNDLGNKYGEKLLSGILSQDITVTNLGKVTFDKHGKTTKYPSRLTYFIAWFKSR